MIVYCSLGCFQVGPSPPPPAAAQTHDKRCSESFYRSEVLGAMKARRAEGGAGERRRVAEALGSALDARGSPPLGAEEEEEEEEEGDEEEESDEEEAAARLSSLLAKEQIALSDLTPYEQSLFLQEIASSSFLERIPDWTPWWTRPLSEHLSSRPLPPDPDPPAELLFETVFRGEAPCRTRAPDAERPALLEAVQSASPMVVFQLLQVMLSYCVRIREFHGDWSAEPVEFAVAVSELSPVLSEGRVFYSVTEVLRSAPRSALVRPALQDLQLLLGTPHYIADLVFDLHRCLRACAADKSQPKADRKSFWRMEQKLHYYDSFCQVAEAARWSALREGVQVALETDFAS